MSEGALAPQAVIPLEVPAPRFSWPLKGTRTFTPKGVRILASGPDAVTASAEGRVAFVDQEMPGYGRVIIVEHSAGFASVYAGVSEILVPLGKTVRAGETLARAGSGPVYFEVRRHDSAVDPATILQG